jgi:hypothetical protein
MMRTAQRTLAPGILVVSAALSGCAPAMRPVTFQATPIEWRRLAGEWGGEYWMRSGDRHGLITFKLMADEQAASGDVLMISDRFGWPYERYAPGPRQYREPHDRSHLLTILFVRADDGQIAGRMDPYWDPDRRCTAVAAFHGSVDGDAIYGTVSSTCVNDPAHSSMSGRWKVVRKGPSPAR